MRDTRARVACGWASTLLLSLAAAGPWASVGCGDGSAPGRSPTSPVSAAGEPAAAPEAPAVSRSPAGADSASPPAAAATSSVDRAPPLAEQPNIDLVANRYRFHLYPGGLPAGLHVPLAAEGLRKYARDYRSPWGPVAAVDGTHGRALSKRRAALDIPIDQPGSYRLLFRAYSESSRQRMTVTVNGRRLGQMALTAGWQQVATEPVELRAGENRVEWRVKRRERITTSAGRLRTYGLWRSLRVAPARADGEGTAETPSAPLSPVAPSASPIGGRDASVLTGFQRLELYLEVPETAWLEVHTGPATGQGAGRRPLDYRISAQIAPEPGRDSQRVTLLEHAHATDDWRAHQISLAALAGQLVRLEFVADDVRAAWGQPRIALERAPVSEFQPVRNLVLLVIDTLRADRLGLYADTRVQTQHIDAAAARGAAVFLHNQAASPSSPPSHASIHTGTVPRVHGVAGDANQVRADVPLLSALAREAGLMTGYVGNNNFAMSRVKKQAQFHRFYEPVFNKQGVDCQPVSAAMSEFVEDHKDKRFFLSGLPIEPHVPYRFHEGITDQYFSGPYKRPIGKKPGSKLISRITAGRLRMDETRWQQIRALYDGEVHYVDECFGTFMAALKERELLADTGIIITADHGEGMYEHGRMGHAFGHFAELSNVPFIVIWPPGHPMAGKVRKHATATSLIDIAPTALSLLGLSADPSMQGRDMLPVMRRQGPWPARVVPMEYGKSYALRARAWKYMVDYSGRERLYHAQSDPTEQREIADTAPMALRYMRESAGFYLAHRTRWKAATWGEYNDHGPGLAEFAERSTGP